MKNNININEQDIFKYVFSPHLLSKEKTKYLGKDERYKNQILYYKSIREAVYSKTSSDLKSKIASKIPSYRLANIFFLSPVNYVEEKKSNGSLIFAAKTAEEPSKLSTYTFTDEEKNFLVRVVSFENSTKVYLFSLKEDLIQNITLKIFPGEEEFFMKDNSESLELDRKIKVESIEIKIN